MKPSRKQQNAILLNLPSHPEWTYGDERLLAELAASPDWDPEELSAVVGDLLAWHRLDGPGRDRAVREIKAIIHGFPEWSRSPYRGPDREKLARSIMGLAEALGTAGAEAAAKGFDDAQRGFPDYLVVELYARTVGEMCEKAASEYRKRR